jgi:hypothetical protein
MVSKKFGDLLVEVELEEDEMWRKGTIRIGLEKGDLYDCVYVSPPLVKEFRETPARIVDLVKFEDWLMDMKKICDENDLDFEDVRQSLEVQFTKDGHPCGIDYHDPFHNPGNKLNPRH